MSFVDSIKYCFNNYANFEGRASRSQFWWFTLFLVLVGWAVELVDFLIFRHNNIHVLYYVWFLVTIVPHLAVGARRLHDMGQSGWYQLLWLACCIGGIVPLVMYIMPAQPGPNQYGDVAV